jgi:putative molybdopterin biosynthesis protein
MSKRNIFVENTPLAVARNRWQDALAAHGLLNPLPVEGISVDDALGRITAAPVYAPNSSPFYNGAAMDGIAVRFADTIGASEANPVCLMPVSQYIYVNTGNVLPEGFDAVIMIEDVQDLDDGRVEIVATTTPWKHVRTIGEDIVTTELILPEGHCIRPIDQAAMLATGLLTVRVRPRPRAVVIPTGSELVQPGEPLSPGKIIEFNSHLLGGYLKEWGCTVDRHAIVRDDRQSLKEAVRQAAASYDLVVINAGASAGTEDHTLGVLAELGEVVVHGVNIKPGKPVVLALVDNTPVIGLPGYPVSALLTQRLFVRPLISVMQGLEPVKADYAEATMARPLSSKLGVEEFVRVKLGHVDDTLVATPAGRGAGAVMSFVQADGILTVPAGSEGVGSGEKVQVELLRSFEEIKNTLVFIGSHDNILDILANLLHRQRPVIRLSSAHVGSMGGILAVKRNEAHLAGSHLLDEETGEYNIPFIQKYLDGVPLLLVNLTFRQQGLLVPKGNPKGIAGFADLTRPEVCFINRQRGAGTRLLTDHHLQGLDIAPEQVAGYDREEYTHMNVAQAVASGSADTGLAIMAAAVALDLDFIPVAEERYDLIVPKAHIDDPKVSKLLDIIRTSDVFRDAVNNLGGYDLRTCGNILYEQ